MNHAMYNFNTVIREEVLPNVWLEIGGSLTHTGRERLRVLLETYPKK